MVESKLDYGTLWLWKLNIKLVVVLECHYQPYLYKKTGPDGIQNIVYTLKQLLSCLIRNIERRTDSAKLT